MSKKIIGDMSVQGNALLNDKNTIRDINNVTADEQGNINFPFYNKEYIDKITSTLPVSRVGSMDYLPMNINGSFEGSTNYSGKGVFPIITESDGTVVYLRPGTNGSTFGYYYSFIENARTVLELVPTLTNEKFIPKSFSQNHKLNAFVSTNAQELLMMKTNNGTDDTYTISLTNGTLNPISHQNVEFPASLISDTDPQYAVLLNDSAYILCLDGYSNTSEMAISVYKISKSDIIAGTYTSLSKITGFNGNNLFGDAVVSSDNIKLASLYFSNTPEDKSLYCIPTGNVYRGFYVYWGNQEGSLHAETSNDKIRIAFVHGAEISTQQAASRSITAISLVLDTTTKNYVFDMPAAGQVTITTNSNGIATWNNPYSSDMTRFSGLSTGSSLNRVPTYTLTSDGVQFCAMARHDTFPEHTLSRAKISNFTTKYDAWNVTNRQLNSVLLKSVPPVFGSVIGENLIHPTIISASKILMHCSGTYNNEPTDINSVVYTELSGSPTYQYKSVVTGGTISGFAPNANRGILTHNDNRFLGCITVMDQNSTTRVYGSSFFEGFNKFSALEMNQNDFSYSQELNIGSAVLSTLKADMISSVNLPYPVLQSFVGLFYVPEDTYTKSFAVVTVRLNAPVGTVNSYIILSEVDVSVASNTVSSASILSSYLISRGVAASSVSTNLFNRMGGLIIAKYQEFTYVGIPTVYSVNTSSGNFASLICKVDNGTKMITGNPKLISTGYNSSTANTYEVGVLPGIGFGLFENGTITDIKTKLVFKNFGTTESQFDAMISNPASNPTSRIVVAAQDVAQGFIVYFTQSIPIFIQGKYYEMPITSIDLSSIDANPGNKTFYLYITVIEGVPTYQISSSLMSEELYRIYVGTIVTGASAITSITTEKVSRFLTYRTSTTKRGSAIPASTGVPSGTGTRWN